MGHIDYAKRIFKHYFRLLAEKSGVLWDWENESEIDEAVESLVKAALDRVYAHLKEASHA
ncbi:MAG: hypothetical protein JXA37_11380 [Chloroflexia bacterium]|nr:hypothetical protein [Chloroflexia bacterium]